VLNRAIILAFAVLSSALYILRRARLSYMNIANSLSIHIYYIVVCAALVMRSMSLVVFVRGGSFHHLALYHEESSVAFLATAC
jgi:hypothetical protein